MESDPYTPPTSSPSGNVPAAKSPGRRMAGLGVVLFSGPVWGLLGTVISMLRAFDTLAANDQASPEALAANIGAAFVTTVIGLSVGIIGAVLIFVALLTRKNRDRWFFQWSVGLALFWCLAIFPYGLIVGLPIAFLCINRRGEFRKSTPAAVRPRLA